MQLLIPKVLGVEVPQDKLDAALEDLNGSLKLIEEKFLQDRPFIAGDHISLADLVAIVEVMQVCRAVFKLRGAIKEASQCFTKQLYMNIIYE